MPLKPEKQRSRWKELGCYIDPTIYSDNEALNREVDSLNKMTAASITYTFGSRTEVVDRTLIKGWLVRGDDGTYSLDTDQVAAYVKRTRNEI